MDRRILVTGAARGLGFALHKALGGVAFVRGSKAGNVATSESAPYDAIIHCAVNSTKSVRLDDAYSYLQDNFLLTQELLHIPHRRFVYVSSVDVYARGSSTPVRAESNHEVVELPGLYTSTKLFSEALVRERGTRPLILRPTTLMGSVMRPNSTYRLLTERDCRLFLSPMSRFNYVLHSDIADFVKTCLERDISGVFNTASASELLLGEIAEQLGVTAQFGSYNYDVGLVDQSPAAEICPAFARPSWKTLNLFIDTLGPRFIGKGRLDPNYQRSRSSFPVSTG
jgi:nucleoside-diphosphate-sugar epimerase